VPRIAETDEEIENCFEVMSQLRPHIDQADFLSMVRLMESEGYRIAFLQEEGKVVAVAGYRILNNLHMGKHLYINDLVTSDDERSRGHGKRLIKWLRTQARSAGCGFIDLDSGTHRVRAHKFYYEQDFAIASFHFSEELGD